MEKIEVKLYSKRELEQMPEQDILEYRNYLFKQRTPQSDAITNCAKILGEIKRIKDLHKIYEMKTKSEEEQMAFYMKSDPNDSMELYRERASFFRNLGFETGGTLAGSDSVVLRMTLFKDRSTNEKTIEVINKVLPYCGIVNDMKRFGIFEHTLSERGTFELHYHVNDCEWQISKTAWSMTEIIRKSDNLEDIIDYLSQHHYYEESEK